MNSFFEPGGPKNLPKLSDSESSSDGEFLRKDPKARRRRRKQRKRSARQEKLFRRKQYKNMSSA